jgi:hypothetical protein
VSPLWDIGLIFLIWNFPKEVFFFLFLVHTTTNYESVNASFLSLCVGEKLANPEKSLPKIIVSVSQGGAPPLFFFSCRGRKTRIINIFKRGPQKFLERKKRLHNKLYYVTKLEERQLSSQFWLFKSGIPKIPKCESVCRAAPTL